VAAPCPKPAIRIRFAKSFFHSYRIIYRIRDEQLLQIVTVLHGAQDLAGMQPPAPKP
jgi:plasmid stabilization system protein ParE